MNPEAHMRAAQLKRESSTRGSRPSASDLAADASPFSATTDANDDAADFADSIASGRTYSVRPRAWCWGLHGRRGLPCLPDGLQDHLVYLRQGWS